MSGRNGRERLTGDYVSAHFSILSLHSIVAKAAPTDFLALELGRHHLRGAKFDKNHRSGGD